MADDDPDFMPVQAPEPCVARTIWNSAMGLGLDLHTAQGRHACDEFLRKHGALIEPKELRAHVFQMWREWREEAYGVPDGVYGRLVKLERRIDLLERRLNAPIERLTR